MRRTGWVREGRSCRRLVCPRTKSTKTKSCECSTNKTSPPTVAKPNPLTKRRNPTASRTSAPRPSHPTNNPPTQSNKTPPHQPACVHKSCTNCSPSTRSSTGHQCSTSSGRNSVIGLSSRCSSRPVWGWRR